MKKEIQAETKIYISDSFKRLKNTLDHYETGQNIVPVQMSKVKLRPGQPDYSGYGTVMLKAQFLSPNGREKCTKILIIIYNTK